MAKKKENKVVSSNQTYDMLELYEMYFDYVKTAHELELLGILEMNSDKTKKHALSADFLKRTFNDFLKVKGMDTIDSNVLGVALVLMDTISVQIEKTHKPTQFTKNTK